MAIENVTVAIDEEVTNLESENNDIYSGEITAPVENGTYTATVSAYDDSGNVSVASASLYVSDSNWITPKTDWKSTDRFNISDYNRIKNNLSYLHELAKSLWKPFEISDMGDDISEYTGYWDVDIFNYFESNLDVINQNILTQDFGISQHFYENAPFIKWDELNRIESATLSIYDLLQRQKASIRNIAFRLGTFKEVRI